MNSRIEIRVSSTYKAKIAEEAKKLGLPMSKYLLALVQADMIRKEVIAEVATDGLEKASQKMVTS